MSPSGDVIMRLVKPLPGPGVKVPTMFAAKSRSVGLVVVAGPLLSLVLLPLLAAVTSTGVFLSPPPVSPVRKSGLAAAGEKGTREGVGPAAAAAVVLALEMGVGR